MKWLIVPTLLLLLSGCSMFSDNRVTVKQFEQIDTTSYEFTRALSTFIKHRYKTDLTVEDIMFEMELARYKEWVKTREN